MSQSSLAQVEIITLICAGRRRAPDNSESYFSSFLTKTYAVDTKKEPGHMSVCFL